VTISWKEVTVWLTCNVKGTVALAVTSTSTMTRVVPVDRVTVADATPGVLTVGVAVSGRQETEPGACLVAGSRKQIVAAAGPLPAGLVRVKVVERPPVNVPLLYKASAGLLSNSSVARTKISRLIIWIPPSWFAL
jgi:hypothetical protein